MVSLRLEKGVSAAEGAGFGGGEGAAVIALGFLGNAGDEVSDAATAGAVEPEAGLEAISIARVTDERGAASPHVVTAAGYAGRDLLGRSAEAAIEAMLGRAIGAVEAPDLRE